MSLPIFTKIAKSYKLHKWSEPWRSFSVKGKKYSYFCHGYNTTWKNERTVEVPYIWSLVKQNKPSKVLEVGNVLQHYFPHTHTIVDKYEKNKRVINKDVVDYKPKKKFDLIVSISTLEHVGWDETPKDKTKVLKAVKALKNLLSSGGTLAVTFPLGYNPHVDDYFRNKQFGFEDVIYLQRVSAFNSWKERDAEVLFEYPKYNEPYQNANVIAVGVFTNKK